jgi:hypothetical protein
MLLKMMMKIDGFILLYFEQQQEEAYELKNWDDFASDDLFPYKELPE